MLHRIARDRRVHLDEGKAVILHVVLDRLRAALDRVAVIPVARRDLQQRHQLGARQVAQLGIDADLVDAIALALAHHEGEEEGAAIRRELGAHALHLEIGIAVLEVEAPQQLPVELHALGIVIVAGAEDAQDRLLAAVDHFAQPALAEGVVADEGDPAHQRGAALVDAEDEVHAVLRQLDDLGRHGRREAPAMGVEVEDVLPVRLCSLRRVDRARRKLDHAAQLRRRRAGDSPRRQPG